MVQRCGLLWVSACVSVCSGFVISDHRKDSFFDTRAISTSIHDLNVPSPHYDSLDRRQISNTPTSPFASFTFGVRGDNYTIKLQSCISRNVTLGSYIDRNGTTRALATTGEIHDDVEAAYSEALVRYPSSRPALIARPLYDLVRRNAVAVSDKAKDLLNNKVLCPDQSQGEEIHDELRRLLQDNDGPQDIGGDEWDVAIMQSLIVGGSASFIHWKNRSNSTRGIDVFVTGTLGFVTQFAVSMVQFAGRREWISRSRAKIWLVVTSWFSKLLDLCAQVINKAIAEGAKCLTIAQAQQAARAGPNVGNPPLGQDVIDPEDAPPLQAGTQSIGVPDEASCPVGG